jgi:soluble cytochrome b562
MNRGAWLSFAIILFSAIAAGQSANSTTTSPSKPAPKPTAATAAPAQRLTPTVNPKRIQLLKESYAAASSLNATSRAVLLEKLCGAAEDIEDLEKSWCKELFQVARDQLSTGDLRAHFQTVAARSMSVHYPMTALSMLQSVDITDAQNDERASMARMVFEGVIHFKGAKAYPQLMAAAARLGETGAYPYLASTVLLFGGDLPKSSEWRSQHYTESQVDICNQVLQQGLNYFKKDTGNLRTDFQFMTLLRSASMTGCPSGWMMHQAVTDFADELIRVSTAAINGDEKVKPHAAKMLYESGQHLLQEIDPVLSESVEKRVGAVKAVAETPSTPLGPAAAPDWQSDPAVRSLTQKIGEAENVLNNAHDGTTPHTPEMESAIREGFSAAQKLIQKVDEIDPAAAEGLRKATGANLPAFLDAAMRIWQSAAIAQIEAMPDGEFKAHLLITAAESVQRESEREFVMHRKPF